MANISELRAQAKASAEGVALQQMEFAKNADAIFQRAEQATNTLAECAAELGALKMAADAAGCSKELVGAVTLGKSRIEADLAHGIIETPAREK